MARLLIVEDESHLAQGIKFNLELEGHDGDVGRDGAEAFERLRQGPAWDLILLDVMLPGMDGFELVDRLRKAGDFTPTLMLTAKGLLRRRDWARGADEGPQRARIGEVEVDFASFEVRRKDGTQQLTLLEAMLLKLLVQNAGRIVPKAEILEKVWNLAPDTQTRAVDNFIVRLRRYIEDDPSSPRYLLTVRGVGYRFVPDPGAPAPTTPRS